MRARRPMVAIACDTSGPAFRRRGARCLALAEELTSRGVGVVFLTDAPTEPWLEDQLRARRLERVTVAGGADAQAELLQRLEVTAVVIDSERPRRDLQDAVRRGEGPVLCTVGEPAADVDADIVAAPGVDPVRAPVREGTALLSGPDYLLLPNDVLANRPIAPRTHARVEAPRVLGWFGDAGEVEAALACARVLAASGRPFHARFLCTPQAAAALADVTLADGQQVDVTKPTARSHENVAAADVVLCTAGPATAEMLCLGAAVGLVGDRREQAHWYRSLMVRRAVVGLGWVQDLLGDARPAADKVTRLLSDARERSRLGAAGWRLVDGMGRSRVADALLAAH